MHLGINSSFEEEQIELANRLGIGLLEIGKKRCKEILSSKYHHPDTFQRLWLLANLGVYRCSICGTFSHTDKVTRDPRKSPERSFYIRKQLDRDVLFGNSRKMRFTHFCKDCLELLK